MDAETADRERKRENHRRWREKNRDRWLAQSREAARRYRANNPEAQAEANRRYRAKNPTADAEYARAYREANREATRAASRRWRAENPGAQAASDRKYREANPEKVREMERRYRAANPGRTREYVRAREAGLNKATPAWVDRKDLCYVYDMAVLFGVHVDHIYPLKGKNSCGLHVPWNLQLLPAADNIRKSNKMPDLSKEGYC